MDKLNEARVCFDAGILNTILLLHYSTTVQFMDRLIEGFKKFNLYY